VTSADIAVERVELGAADVCAPPGLRPGQGEGPNRRAGLGKSSHLTYFGVPANGGMSTGKVHLTDCRLAIARSVACPSRF
jgi:hypothetical protein